VPLAEVQSAIAAGLEGLLAQVKGEGQ
jgi:hypothetical protein